MRSADLLAQPFELPCGSVLPNRIAKAAMSEHLADPGQQPGADLCRLYRTWSEGGSGLLISGNVMVDPTHLEDRLNVVLTPAADRDRLRTWARAGQVAGNGFWLQLNHPGRQTPSHINPQPAAPSAGESVAMFQRVGAFAPPRALSSAGIVDVIARFASAARVARETGFSGVQLHAAHGYLVSQFLSPRLNQRSDRWGGSLVNRARFLLNCVAAIRDAVGASFPIGVKLNSADFQQGGFDEAESATVIGWLAGAGVDLIEISGGSYESQAMFDLARDSTRRRQAYFLDFARTVRASAAVPLMVTGGMRDIDVMAGAIREGALDVVGIARPLAVDPAASRKLLAGRLDSLQFHAPRAPVSEVAFFSEGGYCTAQMILMARGEPARPAIGLAETVAINGTHMLRQQLRQVGVSLRRTWLPGT